MLFRNGGAGQLLLKAGEANGFLLIKQTLVTQNRRCGANGTDQRVALCSLVNGVLHHRAFFQILRTGHTAGQHNGIYILEAKGLVANVAGNADPAGRSDHAAADANGHHADFGPA